MQKLGRVFVNAFVFLTVFLGVFLSKPLMIGTVSENIISNPSMETANPSNANQPLDWSTDRWGTNAATFTYPVVGYLGGSASKVQLTARTSGDAKWYFKEVPVIPNKDYVFSDNYTSNISSVIVLTYKLTTGSYSYVTAKTLAASTSWATATVNFKTPANVSTMTVYHLINKVGTLTTDNYSLVPAVAATPTPTVAPTTVPTLVPTATRTPTPTSAPTSVPTLIPTATSTPT